MSDIDKWKKYWDHFDQDLYIEYLIKKQQRDDRT